MLQSPRAPLLGPSIVRKSKAAVVVLFEAATAAESAKGAAADKTFKIPIEGFAWRARPHYIQAANLKKKRMRNLPGYVFVPHHTFCVMYRSYYLPLTQCPCFLLHSRSHKRNLHWKRFWYSFVTIRLHTASTSFSFSKRGRDIGE